MTLATDHRFRTAVVNLRECADAIGEAYDHRQFVAALSPNERAALRKLIGLCEAFAGAYSSLVEQARIE